MAQYVYFTFANILFQCFIDNPKSKHFLCYSTLTIFRFLIDVMWIVQGCGNTMPNLSDLVPIFIQDKLEISVNLSWDKFKEKCNSVVHIR